MKRLTHIDHIGWYIEDESIAYDGRRRGLDVDRLAAYEDTGLEPEQVEHIKNALIGKAIAEVQEFDSIPIKRLQELAQAEKDGRLEVLPPNDPLTLEELREMDGEPVWCIIIDGDYKGESFWVLVSIDTAECICNNWDVILFAYYGKTWLAYRRKLEEGAEWQR